MLSFTRKLQKHGRGLGSLAVNLPLAHELGLLKGDVVTVEVNPEKGEYRVRKVGT